MTIDDRLFLTTFCCAGLGAGRILFLGYAGGRAVDVTGAY